MEKDINPFPNLDLSPRITRVANFALRVLSPLPTEAPLHMSNHYERSHFEPIDGEAVQPQLPFGVQGESQ